MLIRSVQIGIVSKYILGEIFEYWVLLKRVKVIIQSIFAKVCIVAQSGKKGAGK